MELKWVEDFLSLAETLSFSRAAQARNVTQPAFSRRIRSLEEWLGTDLVDRSSYPISLTPAGKMFRDFSQDLVAKIHATRTMLRGETASEAVVHFSAPHALVLNFLADWIVGVRAEFGPMVPRMTATNTYEGLVSLVEGETCDFAVVYHHPQIPIALPGNRYQYLTLKQEALVPVIAGGSRQMQLPGTKARPVPFVAYPASLFMGQIVELILARSQQPSSLLKYVETDLLEAAKAMAVAGRAMAWVPRHLVSRELDDGRLALAGTDAWSEPIDIRIYYSLENRRPLPGRLWEFLTRKLGTASSAT
jgi:DNA-binding transcriptional LysR family regulator